MTYTDATAAAIDDVIGTRPACVRCRGPLNGSPSPDFCSEECQGGWQATQASALVDGGREPDPAMPEGAPVVSLSWLGTPPPGVLARSSAEILDAVTAFVARFNAFPSEHCAPMLALWYAHTHAAHLFYATPRLILDSAEPGSGKTRVLEVAQYLVRAPEMTISATTAALFRMVGDGPITILFDEVDAIFNAKNGGNNEDLRALLNAGYKRSATVSRCVGDARAMKVEKFPVYAPAALAGIAGHMPATITTRAITVHMRRRAPEEQVEPFRERTVEREAAPLREELAAWIDSVGDQLANAAPTMPDGVADRAAEIWEPLLAIADQAGPTPPATPAPTSSTTPAATPAASACDSWPTCASCSPPATSTGYPPATSSPPSPPSKKRRGPTCPANHWTPDGYRGSSAATASSPATSNNPAAQSPRATDYRTGSATRSAATCPSPLPPLPPLPRRSDR